MALSDDGHHKIVTTDKIKYPIESTAAFDKSLLQMVDSTSTPISSRIHSSKELERRHDSGFSEGSQLWSQNSNINESSVRNHYHDDSPPNLETSTVSSHRSATPENSSQPGFKEMIKYYDELAEICPKEKRIGRRVGDEFVDIVSELNSTGIPALSYIFSFLDYEDLLRCQQVSQLWCAALHENRITRRRLKNPATKENTSPVKEDNESPGQITNSGTPLASIQVTSNVSPDSSPVSSPEDWVPENGRFKRFVKAAEQLKTGQQFVKCARCFGPAKLFPQSRRATCVGVSCKYDYCTLCELEFHGASNCAVRAKKKIRTYEKPINSKASKKNLKRL